MSCPDYLVSTLGRRGIGVIQPQSGLDYPFVAPSDDIRYLIADMQISLDDSARYQAADNLKPPFTLKNVYGIGCIENTVPAGFLTPTHAADILVVDAAGQAAFNSTTEDTTFDAKAWGPNYVLYSWKNATGTCSVLAYKTWAETDNDKQHYNKYLIPQDGRLDARAIYVLPKRLLSLRVGKDPTAPKITGNVYVKNGYNTTITASSPVVTDFVVDTPITIAATAGSGLGKYSNCGDDVAPTTTPIRKINGIAPPNGDFLLSAADCFYARRPTKRVGNDVVPDDYFSDANKLRRPLAVGATCDACCKCQDYVDLALTINTYRSQYANIGARVNDVKQIHEQNIQKWIDARSCGLDSTLRLLMVAQRCPYMDVVLMICNPCSECLYSKELKLELSPPAGISSTAELVAGYTALFAAGSNGRPVPITSGGVGAKTIFTVPFPIVKSGDSAYVRFRVKLSRKTEYAVTGVLTGTLLDGSPILTGCADADNASLRTPAQALTTQALYCDENGDTNLP